MADGTTSLTTHEQNNLVREETESAINSCREMLLDLNQKAYEFIVAHDDYVTKNTRDASILKRRMKEKVKEVFNQEVFNND